MEQEMTPSLNPEQKREMHQSWILTAFSGFVEWGNRWITLSGWILKRKEYQDHLFIKLELAILFVTAFCISILFWIHLIPPVFALVLSILLVQRLMEFVLVYSRNFILNRGRIYSHFHDEALRGQWLLVMFGLNIIQLLFVFATWYRIISLNGVDAFNHSLGILDSFYFSVMTFITLGFADIFAVATLPKILVIAESLFFFFTLVVVINGIVSTHFSRR